MSGVRLMLNTKTFADHPVLTDPSPEIVDLHVNKLLCCKTAEGIIKLQVKLSWTWPRLWSAVREASSKYVQSCTSKLSRDEVVHIL